MDAGNPGATYFWESDNGFRSTEQVVSLTVAGNYTFSLKASDGCQVSRRFTITTSTSLLKADFLASTFITRSDTLVLIDVSNPVPENRVWNLPSSARIVQQNANSSIIHVLFEDLGKYEVGMAVQLGECQDQLSKTITVLPEGDKTKINQLLGYQGDLLKELKLFPNPTDGNFSVSIKLNERADGQLTLVNYGTGKILESRSLSANNQFDMVFNRSDLVPAVYMVILRVGDEVHSVKLIKL